MERSFIFTRLNVYNFNKKNVIRSTLKVYVFSFKHLALIFGKYLLCNYKP